MSWLAGRLSTVVFLALLAATPLAAQDVVDDRGTLWFYRESADLGQDPTIFKTVPSFAERLASLPSGTYFALDVPAGLHRFSWTAAPSRNQIISIECRAGENIFIEVRFRSITVVESSKATPLMRGLRPIDLDSAQDERVSLRVFPGRPPALQPRPVAPPRIQPAPVITPVRSQYNSMVSIDLDSRAVKVVPQDYVSGSPWEDSAATPALQAVDPSPPEIRTPPAPAKPDTLTNADVVALVAASLPETLIAAKIRASVSMFETTPQALIKLKGAGVPESLLLLMLEVSNGAPAPVRDSQPPGRQQLRMPVPPKIVYQPELRYPELAQRENVEGMVVLDVTIVKEGMVSDIRVISSPHPVLTEEAVKNVNQWRFESPAVADEKTDVVSTVSIRFALN